MASNTSLSSGNGSIADTSTGSLLDCFITDLQLGKEATSLRAPPSRSISITTPSKESLIPAQVTLERCPGEDDNQSISVQYTSTSIPRSEYSSSIYSKRSSALAETESALSSFPADEILTPRPLDLSRATSASAADCQCTVTNSSSSQADAKHNSSVATFPDTKRPRSTMPSHASSDSGFEDLIKEIVRHPMVEASSTHRLNETPCQSGHFMINQKAARLLGLDGAGSPITPTTPIQPEVTKDIINKEPTSSPHTLRNITSKLSLSGRKKSLQQEKEVSTLGKIDEQAQSKLAEMVEEADRLPEVSGSISRRRGFRPLSIHTGKAFDPFGMGGNVKPGLNEGKLTDKGPETIEADFAILASSTPPDINHHPMFQSDPFSAKSPCPLLKTASGPPQIRESGDRISPGHSSSKESSSDSTSSKTRGFKGKFLFDSELKVANNGDVADPLDLILGGSPLPRNRSSAPPRDPLSVALVQSGESRMSTSYDLNTTPVNSTRRSRGISSWFRQRDKSAEQTTKDSSSAKRESDVDVIQEAQIAYLRKSYNAPSPDYDRNDSYPRHPNTGRSWTARNLKCTICRERLCSCCGRSCCTYRQAYTALGNPLSTTQIKEQAFARMDQINRIFPHGTEVPTFLQCTTGGGCGNHVCPECIGMCPLSICQDTQCRKCKKDPWAICEFHDDGQIRFCEDSAT